jgi:signal transduction histidine kinase
VSIYTFDVMKADGGKQWHRVLGSVRFRILMAYFLITGSIVLVSIHTTRELFFTQLKQRVYASLSEEVARFNTLAEDKRSYVNPNTADGLAYLFDEFLEDYVPVENEYSFAILNGQLYRSSSTPLPWFLKDNPNLIDIWTQQAQHLPPIVHRNSGHKIIFTVEPLRRAVPGSALVVVNDTTTDFRASKDTLTLIRQVSIAVFILSSWLAWIVAGRVLSPLRTLTKTAQSITESDMTQRISLQSNDEIAQLSLTFNEMLDRLQSAFASQQEFLNDAGHELRTPITVIQGQLEILKIQPQRLDATLDVVFDELNRMNRLVNDLILLAKAERPDFLRLHPEELDWLTEELYLKARAFGDGLSQTGGDRQWLLESKGLSPIQVDRHRLTQAIMNLVVNAFRHTQPEDSIAIGSAARNEFAYLWVRDTGEGIAPEDRERIFQRFTRATHSDRYAEGEGAGLGLPIAQAIAEGHGGWIVLDSTLGEGSTFTLVLPLHPPSFTGTDESTSHRRRQSPHYGISRNGIASSRIHHFGR